MIKIKLIDGPCKGDEISVEYPNGYFEGFDVVKVEPTVFDFEGHLIYDTKLIRYHYRIEWTGMVPVGLFISEEGE